MNKYAEVPPEIIERATELAMLELYENANICVEGFNQAQALLDLMDKYISQLIENQNVKIVDKRQRLKKNTLIKVPKTTFSLPIKRQGQDFFYLKEVQQKTVKRRKNAHSTTPLYPLKQPQS
jgi:hypothetical protein